METADNGEELVLRWSGHATHVTERFSGLLARQALVDVTLICQGQKLRVHKLVLASSSLYFEEILEQDLGQEPIILLRDLDFEVLKAMVEFMYCGETTVSQCHLQRLFEAARIFKVKELKCIVESMMKSEKGKTLSSCEDYRSSPSTTSVANRKEHPREIIGEEERNSPSELGSDGRDRPVDVDARVNSIDEDNNSLYEIVEKNEDESSCVSELEESSSDNSSLRTPTSSEEDDEDDSKNSPEENAKIPLRAEENPSNSFCDSPRTYEILENHNCRGVGECSRVYTPKKRKFVANDESEGERRSPSMKTSRFAERSSREENVDRREGACGKGLKVYTHKRRKSTDERISRFFENVRESTTSSSSNITSSIDLGEERTSSEARIFPSLDMETSEYVWSLDAEGARSVVVGSSSTEIAREADDEASRRTQRLFSHVGEETTETPVLRRSLRINQLETDDSFNNNDATASKEDEKSSALERNNYDDDSVTLEATKSRRRSSKNYRLGDENDLENASSIGEALDCRSLRSGTKSSSERSRGATSRDERRKNARRNRDRPDKIVSSDILVNTRLNTIASVDRALWGDMSDLVENRDDSTANFRTKHSTSREIPFAVGLLPLRAALERMQATLDHQPRKTRSSVAPWRQEAVLHGRKLGSDNAARKRTNFGDIETAVCHIEIRTSTGRNDIDERPISADEKIIAVGRNAQVDQQ